MFRLRHEGIMKIMTFISRCELYPECFVRWWSSYKNV